LEKKQQEWEQVRRKFDPNADTPILNEDDWDDLDDAPDEEVEALEAEVMDRLRRQPKPSPNLNGNHHAADD